MTRREQSASRQSSIAHKPSSSSMETQRIIFPVQELFRKTEDVKLILETRSLSTDGVPDTSQDSDDADSIWNNVQKMRAVVVVSHVDPSTGDEQGW